MKHKQVMAMVKVPVDEGVLPLVTALNKIKGVLTVDSCECGIDGLGYVAFRLYGASHEQEMALARGMSVEIGKSYPDLPASISLSWFAGGETPMLSISIRPTHLKLLAEAIERIAPRLVAG